jgi:pyridinium-3,5-biscarboxylic acid mononucleotide synthase
VKTPSMRNLSFARVDLHRVVRRGFPEVVFAPGKPLDQIVQIAGTLRCHRQPVVITKLTPERTRAIRRILPWLVDFPEAGILAYPGKKKRLDRPGKPEILVLSAGTSDLPVAEEAAVTAELMGCRVRRLYDVGVAGLHRLLRHRRILREAKVLVVVAGMEGALPSVVSGLTPRPVIAVPTSIGYGASFRGVAALLTMMNSCSPGVGVVNIDNGFGAGYLAGIISDGKA